jgi:hypothetical protein
VQAAHLDRALVTSHALPRERPQRGQKADNAIGHHALATGGDLSVHVGHGVSSQRGDRHLAEMWTDIPFDLRFVANQRSLTYTPGEPFVAQRTDSPRARFDLRRVRRLRHCHRCRTPGVAVALWIIDSVLGQPLLDRTGHVAGVVRVAGVLGVTEIGGGQGVKPFGASAVAVR